MKIIASDLSYLAMCTTNHFYINWSSTQARSKGKIKKENVNISTNSSAFMFMVVD